MRFEIKRRHFVFFFIVLLPSSAFAVDPPSCPNPQSPRGIYDCFVQVSPELEIGRSEVESSQLLRQKAAQRLNPELDFQAFRVNSRPVANQIGQPTSQWVAGILFPIELGGKVHSRKMQAEGQSLVRKEEFEISALEAKQIVLLGLYRLKQIQSEKEMVQEAKHTFERLVNQFLRRPTLSPEQQVTQSVFKVAEEDYNLKLTQLGIEEKEIERYFILNLKISLEKLRSNLPQTSPSWPNPQTLAIVGNTESPNIRLSAAQLKLTEAQYELAKSESYPDLRIGPYYNRQTQFGQNINYWGVGVLVPLPIFNLNMGGRKVAEAQNEIAKSRLDFVRAQESSRIQYLLQSYQSLVDTLNKLDSYTSYEKKHREMERHFSRGIIPGALVLETHRQIYEQLKSRHESESNALKTLSEIKFIAGQEVGDLL